MLTITAPNPGPLTGDGTNTYVLDGLVVDPGPDDSRHLAAILAAGPVRAIVVTHGHADHDALAPALARATGATVLAWGDAARAYPHVPLADGDTVGAFRVIHGPGHHLDHLCFDDGARLLTGDTAMGHASSLVTDMSAYTATLRRLIALGPRRLLPGHGPPVEDGVARLRWLLDHRLAREGDVLRALAAGPVTAEGLAEAVYAGLPREARGAGALTLLAHLVHLEERGLARGDGASTRAAFRAP